MASPVYIYGVILDHQQKKFNLRDKTEWGEVYTISYLDVSCVAGDYQKASFDFRDREEAAEQLIRHQTVIENVMKDYTIIPFKFGSILDNSHEVKKVLEKGYHEFKKGLQEMDKKIELDVVAVWNDLDSIIKKIGRENEEISSFKQNIAKKSPQDSFQERVKIGSMIKDALDEKRHELQTEMVDILEKRTKIYGSKKHEHMNDTMILNCAFLLDKNRESEFDQALHGLNERYNGRINFRCVGPLPPYSFSTYEVKEVNFRAIDKARNLLGLGEEVDESDIKGAYRKLIQGKHPDKCSSSMEAQRLFDEIQKAHKLLLNYCRSGKKSLKKEDVEGDYIISIFDAGHLQ